MKSNIVPLLKYAKANEQFAGDLSGLIDIQTARFTQATEPLTGAVIILFGRDSMDVVRIGETPELVNLIDEIEGSY